MNGMEESSISRSECQPNDIIYDIHPCSYFQSLNIEEKIEWCRRKYEEYQILLFVDRYSEL